jgi:hypothetical protein
MTNDPEDVNVHVVYSSNERVMVGNGQSLFISHTGSISTLVPNNSLLLSNVLVVPGITKKLISISQLTKDNNCWVIFLYSSFTIQDRPGHTSCDGDRQMWEWPIRARATSSCSCFHSFFQ